MKIAFNSKIDVQEAVTKTININRSGDGNTLVDTVILEVESTAGITLKGAMDSDNTFGVSAVKISGFEIVDTITEAGIYYVPAEGLNKLILDIQGASVINVRGVC